MGKVPYGGEIGGARPLNRLAKEGNFDERHRRMYASHSTLLRASEPPRAIRLSLHVDFHDLLLDAYDLACAAFNT